MNVTTYTKTDITLYTKDVKTLDEAQNLILLILNCMDDVKAKNVNYYTYDGDMTYSYETLKEVKEILDNLKEINEIF